MEQNKFSGTAEITDEGIKKHFRTFDSWRAIGELIWNGFDARATEVSVSIAINDMHGLESITVTDDGDGIDFNNVEDNFRKFNESSKRNDDDKHGSHGRGRLSFHRLCGRAVWFTKHNNENAKIIINSDSIKDFSGELLDIKSQHACLKGKNSGTCVELVNFSANTLPAEEKLLEKLSIEFGWFLALNKNRTLRLNGIPIKVPAHDLHETEIEVDGVNFNIKLIRWDDRPSSEKSYCYLVSGDYRIINKELSSFNNKFKFHTSAYVFSDWVEKFEPGGMELTPEYTIYSPVYKKLIKKLMVYQNEIYQDFLRKHVDEVISKYDQDGIFPEYKGVNADYASWRKENTKSFVKEIYVADPSVFSTLNIKQSKILIRLLDKILISNENDSLFEVLQGVIDLESESLEALAEQLSKTTLDNIISTIETLHRREEAVSKLREIMEKHYSVVLETPDLQKTIENNTWLFGSQYTTLGAEEDSFHTIAKNLRDTVKDIDLVTESDIANGANVDGINRQVDLFLVRKVPQFDSTGKLFYKCIIIEIKRPGISLNKKHLQQIDDYAEIISKHDAFGSENMRFEVILIGRKISKDDFAIKQRLENLKDKGEQGLVTNGRIKCYVRNWFTIFDEFELSNSYLLNTLNTKLNDLSGTSVKELVEDLQAGTS